MVGQCLLLTEGGGQGVGKLRSPSDQGQEGGLTGWAAVIGIISVLQAVSLPTVFGDIGGHFALVLLGGFSASSHVESLGKKETLAGER